MYGYEFQSVNMQMLCTVFACMTWPDSTVCHKATRLAMSFIREVCANSLNSVNCSFAQCTRSITTYNGGGETSVGHWHHAANYRISTQKFVIIFKIPAVSIRKSCRHQCPSLQVGWGEGLFKWRCIRARLFIWRVCKSDKIANLSQDFCPWL